MASWPSASMAPRLSGAHQMKNAIWAAIQPSIAMIMILAYWILRA
ncbi:hypothetical protein ACFV3R_00445 [Streptomyces sp. NPDC059740]